MTFLGHVGFFVETRGGSVLCDPWFTPAYFGSWFPFPRNDGLDPAGVLLARLPLHLAPAPRPLRSGVARSPRRQAARACCCPTFGVPFLERELRAIGFEHFVPHPHGETARSRRAARSTILAFTDAGRRPARRLAASCSTTARRACSNQNDARPGDPDELRALGPFDAQIVQFSGAIWYPIAYDFPPELKPQLARDKRVNQMARARQYIEWVDAAHVFPCAGPPAFLDDDLFALQRLRPRSGEHLSRPDGVPRAARATRASTRGELIVPGLGRRARRRRVQGHASRRPTPSRCGRSPTSARTSTSTGATGQPWLARRARVVVARTPRSRRRARGVVRAAAAARADHVGRDRGQRRARRRRAGRRTCASTSSSREVRRGGDGEPYVYKADVDRRLIEALLERHVEDWVNSLFLSCRFVGHRPDPANFNEFVMTFFKALSPERIAYVERLLPRAPHSAPTSSSSATAGASSAGARTARPTSRASARSTTACSRAACTTGSSTSRPAGA